MRRKERGLTQKQGGTQRARLLVCLLLGIFILGSCGAERPEQSERSKLAVTGADGQTDDRATSEEAAPVPEEIPLYDIPDVGTIDIYAVNRMPAERVSGTKWDKSLFYWLEDISRENLEDGYLAKCLISKAVLRNSENGQLIQYEVYRDPQTAEIYKIVSIEEEGDRLRLTDYYYRDGIPNFVFVRHDSVYTPTYATTGKTGERYYFASDMMVQWRVVRTPGKVEDCTISPSQSSKRKTDYFQQDEAARKAYDDMELRMLNAAYNTYDAISSYNSIGVMEGIVQDTSGAGVGGATLEVRRKGDNVLLSRVATAPNGSFKCHLRLDGTECILIVRAGEAFKTATVYGIILKDSGITGAYGTILLGKAGVEEYPVHINIYIADDIKSKEDGSLENIPASGAVVILREGAGAREGEPLLTLKVGEGGSLDTALPSGVYTAQIDAPDCARTFLEIRVEDGAASVDGYVLQSLREGMAGVLLTWTGADVDLDLTLFTPFQSTAGDMAHVGGQVSGDEHGNSLLSDNSAGCEVIYVNTTQDGSYKLYVSDYTNIQAGNYSADVLGKIDIHIYIYDSTGLVAEYVFPAGQKGVVWEVAEISGNRITPNQRVYDRMDGKSWWLEKKEKKRTKRLVQEVCYPGNLNSNEWEQPSILEYSYDSRGHLTKKVGYAGVYMSYINEEYDYDSQGNLIKTTIQYDESGSMKHWTENSYDNRGNLIKSAEYNDKGIYNWTENSYDNRGNLIKSAEYGSKGIYSWTENSYDSQGNLTRSAAYWYNKLSWERNYDSQGRLVREVEEGDDDYYEYNYEYDDWGNLKKTITCVPEIYDVPENFRYYLTIEYKNKYDSRGNLIRREGYYNDGSLCCLTENTYDREGNLVQESDYRYGGANIQSSLVKKYDDQGNVVEEIMYDNYIFQGWEINGIVIDATRTVYIYE